METADFSSISGDHPGIPLATLLGWSATSMRPEKGSDVTIGRNRNIVVGAIIALLVFATVPLAQVAGRHGGATATVEAGHAVADRIGSVVTNLVETHTRMSVALSEAAR